MPMKVGVILWDDRFWRYRQIVAFDARRLVTEQNKKIYGAIYYMPGTDEHTFSPLLGGES